MFEDGIVRKKQIGFDPETSMHCFGGGGGGGGGGGSTQKEPEKTGGKNYNITQMPSINGNALVATPNYTRTLPNGIVVEDYSRPYNEMSSTPAPTPAPSRSEISNLPSNYQGIPNQPAFYDELAVGAPQRQQTRVGEIISSSPMDMFNNAPVTAGQAFNEALAPGQISGGRIGVGGGVSVGRVPGGYGIQYDRRFAQGGPVTAGIGSLGLPQAMFKSTKS
jgi:hypothetical protein